MVHNSFIKHRKAPTGIIIRIIDNLLDMYERVKYRDLYNQAEEQLEQVEAQKDFIEYALDRVEKMKK